MNPKEMPRGMLLLRHEKQNDGVPKGFSLNT
jgi:hypothetical protein